MTPKPKPTHYTPYQGGSWLEWPSPQSGIIVTKFFAVKFEDGSIFDGAVGWKESPLSEETRLTAEILDAIGEKLVHVSPEAARVVAAGAARIRERK